MYQAAVFPKDIEKTVSLFSSIITNPLFLNQDINEVKQSTLFEIDDLKLKPDTYIPEILHATAFNNSGFGRPLFCSEDKLSSVTSDQLVEYHRLWYTANRIVVAGVGMSHQALLEAVAGKFDGIPKGSDEILGLQQKSIDNQPVRYVGGVKLIDTDSLPPSPNPEDIPLTRIHIAFESLSMNDPDIYALATLASLMGGIKNNSCYQIDYKIRRWFILSWRTRKRNVHAFVYGCIESTSLGRKLQHDQPFIRRNWIIRNFRQYPTTQENPCSHYTNSV